MVAGIAVFGKRHSRIEPIEKSPASLSLAIGSREAGLSPTIFSSYFPTTNTTKLSGTMGGRGCGVSAVGAGAVPKSAVTT